MSSAASSDELRLHVVDAVCDHFERCWTTGKKPRLSAFLEPFGDDARSLVFEELLRVDIELRHRCGETPSADGYTSRYPEFGNEVERVFADETATRPPRSAPPAEVSRLLDLVRAIPPFDETPSEVLADLLDRAELRTWPPDSHLLQQGERSDALVLLAEGVAEVVHSSPLGERPVTKVGPGTVLGEISILTGEPCTANVVARGAVSAFMVPRRDVDDLAKRHPTLPAALYHLVSQRLGRGLRDVLYGLEVGDYRILECLGRGGAAVVYKGGPAEATPADAEPVALKFLHHALVTDHRAVRRFEQEADIGGRLSHPNVVAVRGLLPAFGTHVMIQEFVDGRSLDVVLGERGRFEGAELRRVVGQIAAALAHSHERRVLHHDVTPANVMLTEDGTARLTDFGLARIGDLDNLTVEKAIVGTPAYMPPECFGHGPLTTAADVYGLGCIALEMWTGRTPVVGRSLMETMSIRSSWSLPPRKEIDPVPDEELYDFLDRSLRHEPRERQVDLAEVARWGES